MSDLCPVAVRKVSVEDEYQPPTIGGSLHLLLMQKKYCDVTFTFPNLPDRIEAHEFILKARSPVFAKIFQLRKSGNVQSKEIEIIHLHGSLGVDMAGALDLLQISHKYKVQPLAKKCEELLKTKVPVLDSPLVFEAARRHGLLELMDRAGRIMIKFPHAKSLETLANVPSSKTHALVFCPVDVGTRTVTTYELQNLKAENAELRRWNSRMEGQKKQNLVRLKDENDDSHMEQF